MNGHCPILAPTCIECNCAGISCQSQFPGSKLEWPELRGVSAPEAKGIIERENPKVVAVIIPEDAYYIFICCNRVILYVPVDNFLNGPVLNRPKIG